MIAGDYYMVQSIYPFFQINIYFIFAIVFKSMIILTLKLSNQIVF